MTPPHAPQAIQPAGFFVLRTPLRPLDDLMDAFRERYDQQCRAEHWP